MIASHKPPFKTIFQEDESNNSDFKQLKINNFSDINEKLLIHLDTGYMLSKQLDNAVYFTKGNKIEELHQIPFKKFPKYSTSLVRYALMLRYTSLQAYKILHENFLH